MGLRRLSDHCSSSGVNAPRAAPFSDSSRPGAFVVVEDDAEVQRAVVLLLRECFPRRRVELFGAGRPAIAFCESETVELLLTDLGLPDVHGLELIRHLRSRGRIEHVIVMTGSPTDNLPRALWDLGVLGFIDKISLHDHLRAAIERVLAGGMYFSAQITPARLPEAPAGPVGATSADGAGLSARERDVARLVATGLITKEIAAKLHLSPRTVEKYRTRVMRKVGARSTPQLVYWCLRQGLA
jgi:two-component system, NarL family, invasion response regulator UvrY